MTDSKREIREAQADSESDNGFPYTAAQLAEMRAAGIDTSDFEPEDENITPLFPDVQVNLDDEDGNGAYLIALVSRELRRGGHGDAVEAFQREARSADYLHVIDTICRTVDVV